MTKIKKIDYELEFPTVKEYEAARAKFIAEYKEYQFSFFSSSYKQRPDVGEAKWNAYYPQGYSTWAGQNGHHLTGYGQQKVIDKINEIIEALNALTQQKEKSRK